MTDAGRDDETGTLDAAIAATKRHFQGASEHADATELRILTAARQRTRPRRALWLAPIAAAFVISAAFAGEIGTRLADLGQRIFGRTAAQPISPAPAAPAPAAAAASSAPVASSAPAAVGELSEPAVPEAVPMPSATSPVPRSTPPPAAPASAPSASATAADASSAAPDDLALYKQAHRAHFEEQNYARALAGWDQYLARAPRGTFALEARYNRAIALQRLGNRAAAIEALQPFADGAYGRYRQEEARQLIEQSR
jgi:tetratricopeptide (TPR) repeat protein